MPAGSCSAEEEQKLLQLIRETGLTQREIAQKLGRTEAAVSARLAIIRKLIASNGKTGNKLKGSASRADRSASLPRYAKPRGLLRSQPGRDNCAPSAQENGE